MKRRLLNGDKALVYKAKFESNLKESFRHLNRLRVAFLELEKKYAIPFNTDDFKILIDNIQDLAFADQIIYRFSKLQNIVWAKLFKSYLLSQGENVDKPFLDILNQLEKLDILEVEEWFELRDIRNSIAHTYEGDENIALSILNTIFRIKNDILKMLETIKK